jgi:DNA ligase D-like protein (predicted ligase)
MKGVQAGFIEPMLLLRKESLPAGKDWMYELKLDGYRAIGFKASGSVQLRSRNDNDFAMRYPAIAKSLRSLPDHTVVDGEIVALDEEGRPSFNLLQNYGSSGIPLHFYVFDLIVLAGVDLRRESLSQRRTLLEKKVLPKLDEPLRYSVELKASLADLIASVKAQGLEGLVAKRPSSLYEAGQRSGSWQKMRINRGQEFVIGGYTVSERNFDALIFGIYQNAGLQYIARTRNGFTPALRQKLFDSFRSLHTEKCPFVNLPEKRAGRWGQGLTIAKMKDCRWLKPKLVGQFEFSEWTPDDHLRHSRFVSLRDDKAPTEVIREC